MSDLLESRAVIQAGGEGRRMRPASEKVPKHILPVQGVPIVVRLLRQLIRAGFRDVSIIVGYRGDVIAELVNSLDDLPDDLCLKIIWEREPRGDIGSISDLPADARPLLTVYGDLVTDIDFSRLLEVHRRRKCSITLASHYDSLRIRYGELVTDGARVLRYVEKPTKQYLVCSGIAVLNEDVVKLVPRDRPIGLDQLVELAISKDMGVTHWEHGASWLDINTSQDLALANAASL